MHVELSETLTNLDRCPQCNAYKPTLNFLFSCCDSRASGTGHGPGWVIYRCSACYDVVAFGVNHWMGMQEQQARAYLNQARVVSYTMIPNGGAASVEGLPDRAANYMRQAIGSLFAPDGAVMLACSAVDAMLKEKGYEKGSVYDRINKAVEDHILTADMAEWAHSVRLEANKPRHADLDDPHATEAEAKQSIEFAKALGDFLFVFPARVAAGKAAADSAGEASG